MQTAFSRRTVPACIKTDAVSEYLNSWSTKDTSFKKRTDEVVKPIIDNLSPLPCLQTVKMQKTTHLLNNFLCFDSCCSFFCHFILPAGASAEFLKMHLVEVFGEKTACSDTTFLPPGCFFFFFLTFAVTVLHLLQYVLLLPRFLLLRFAVSTRITQNTLWLEWGC